MRPLTAAQAKGRVTQTHLVPREGTRLRRAFDLFMANKGIPVNIHGRFRVDVVYYLNDFYGLDIRRLHNNEWVLAGEWFGPTYIDYIADRLNKESKTQ